MKKKITRVSPSYLGRFTAMPFLIKLFFVLGVVAVVQSGIDLLTGKPTPFTYYGTDFPRNYPILWHLYAVGINLFSLVVFIKRSYRLLKVYIGVSAAVLMLSLGNSLYTLSVIPEVQRTAVGLVYGITYAFGIVIFVYFLRQKKYFNEP
jgi:hypothetical protein